MSVLQCDMKRECPDLVTHIDVKGYVYCAKHGQQRKSATRCRKLTAKELRALRSGQALARY